MEIQVKSKNYKEILKEFFNTTAEYVRQKVLSENFFDTLEKLNPKQIENKVKDKLKDKLKKLIK